MAENRRTKPHLPMRERPLRRRQPARCDRDHEFFYSEREYVVRHGEPTRALLR
jgi:hypothetical protein